MKIFIDSANFQEIKEAVSWGIIDGATTNPSLMAKETGQSVEKLSRQICEIVPGPVSLEGIAMTSEELVKEGRILTKIASNVIFKIPMSIEGMKAVQILNKEGIKTNVTLIFTSNQAMLAAKSGASYVSPFIGRLDDIGEKGIELIKEIKTVFTNYQYKTEILAASIRSREHVKQAALAGADIATMPFKVLKELFQHDLTDKGISIFLNDWKKLKV
ncbi:MAG: fructose-6-phosphate aldolase [Patescibacteria group bacterium]|jgi:transaldolase